jgi:hypothetical protein
MSNGKTTQDAVSNGNKVLNSLFLSLCFVAIAAGLLSIFFPLGFSVVVTDVCGRASFLCAPSDLYNEVEQMASLGHADYGVGLQAFRRLGPAITALGTIALIVAHFASGAARQKLRLRPIIPAIQPLDIPIGIAVALFFV